ncbi:MAG: hypothetical protein Q8Q32_00345 [bacterium]|nr:hypothetical protein [bacterium]
MHKRIKKSAKQFGLVAVLFLGLAFLNTGSAQVIDRGRIDQRDVLEVFEDFGNRLDFNAGQTGIETVQTDGFNSTQTNDSFYFQSGDSTVITGDGGGGGFDSRSRIEFGANNFDFSTQIDPGDVVIPVDPVLVEDPVRIDPGGDSVSVDTGGTEDTGTGDAGSGSTIDIEEPPVKVEDPAGETAVDETPPVKVDDPVQEEPPVEVEEDEPSGQTSVDTGSSGGGGGGGGGGGSSSSVDSGTLSPGDIVHIPREDAGVVVKKQVTVTAQNDSVTTYQPYIRANSRVSLTPFENSVAVKISGQAELISSANRREFREISVETAGNIFASLARGTARTADTGFNAGVEITDADLIADIEKEIKPSIFERVSISIDDFFTDLGIRITNFFRPGADVDDADTLDGGKSSTVISSESEGGRATLSFVEGDDGFLSLVTVVEGSGDDKSSTSVSGSGGGSSSSGGGACSPNSCVGECTTSSGAAGTCQSGTTTKYSAGGAKLDGPQGAQTSGDRVYNSPEEAAAAGEATITKIEEATCECVAGGGRPVPDPEPEKYGACPMPTGSYDESDSDSGYSPWTTTVTIGSPSQSQLQQILGTGEMCEGGLYEELAAQEAELENLQAEAEQRDQEARAAGVEDPDAAVPVGEEPASAEEIATAEAAVAAAEEIEKQAIQEAVDAGAHEASQQGIDSAESQAVREALEASQAARDNLDSLQSRGRQSPQERAHIIARNADHAVTAQENEIAQTEFVINSIDNDGDCVVDDGAANNFGGDSAAYYSAMTGEPRENFEMNLSDGWNTVETVTDASGNPVQATDDFGNPQFDSEGNPIFEIENVHYSWQDPDGDGVDNLTEAEAEAAKREAQLQALQNMILAEIEISSPGELASNADAAQLACFQNINLPETIECDLDCDAGQTYNTQGGGQETCEECGAGPAESNSSDTQHAPTVELNNEPSGHPSGWARGQTYNVTVTHSNDCAASVSGDLGCGLSGYKAPTAEELATDSESSSEGDGPGGTPPGGGGGGGGAGGAGGDGGSVAPVPDGAEVEDPTDEDRDDQNPIRRFFEDLFGGIGDALGDFWNGLRGEDFDAEDSGEPTITSEPEDEEDEEEEEEPTSEDSDEGRVREEEDDDEETEPGLAPSSSEDSKEGDDDEEEGGDEEEDDNAGDDSGKDKDKDDTPTRSSPAQPWGPSPTEPTPPTIATPEDDDDDTPPPPPTKEDDLKCSPPTLGNVRAALQEDKRENPGIGFYDEEFKDIHSEMDQFKDGKFKGLLAPSPEKQIAAAERIAKVIEDQISCGGGNQCTGAGGTCKPTYVFNSQKKKPSDSNYQCICGGAGQSGSNSAETERKEEPPKEDEPTTPPDSTPTERDEEPPTEEPTVETKPIACGEAVAPRCGGICEDSSVCGQKIYSTCDPYPGPESGYSLEEWNAEVARIEGGIGSLLEGLKNDSENAGCKDIRARSCSCAGAQEKETSAPEPTVVPQPNPTVGTTPAPTPKTEESLSCKPKYAVLKYGDCGRCRQFADAIEGELSDLRAASEKRVKYVFHPPNYGYNIAWDISKKIVPNGLQLPFIVVMIDWDCNGTYNGYRVFAGGRGSAVTGPSGLTGQVDSIIRNFQDKRLWNTDVNNIRAFSADAR